MDLQDNFHEITTSDATNSSNDVDIRHVQPDDGTVKHIWVWEPVTKTGVLTQDGITQIAFHQYRAGTYTTLDNLCNPLWTHLTELLPMSMAPNLVTTLGALHCLVSYVVTWYYTPTFASQEVPAWVILLNCYCMLAYYTLDCMDGKQARRTNSSSPLGQLFDHGVDCICNLSHVSMIHSWMAAGLSSTGSTGTGTTTTTGGGVWVVVMSQGVLQFSFLVAQWEEYYTGKLPHATGDFGVTEVNYGLGALTGLNALLSSSRRTALYTTPLSAVTPFWLVQIFDSGYTAALPTLLHVLPTTLAEAVVGGGDLEVRHGLLLGFVAVMSVLIAMSVSRVLSHVTVATNPLKQLSALSKLVTPALLTAAPLLLPNVVLQRELRHVSLTCGLALCLVTIKLIVFGMAKRSYAVLQLDAVPAVAVLAWIRMDGRFTVKGQHALLVVTTVWYLNRIYQWTGAAIRQICQRLDIYLFTIKAKDKAANAAVTKVNNTNSKTAKESRSSGMTNGGTSDSNNKSKKS
jgi:ethanolaminephosphotransferase